MAQLRADPSVGYKQTKSNYHCLTNKLKNDYLCLKKYYSFKLLKVCNPNNSRGYSWLLDSSFSYPVIFRITFIRSTTTLSLDIVELLRPTFIPIRWVDLALKLPSDFALKGQSLSNLKKPLHTSVTF